MVCVWNGEDSLAHRLHYQDRKDIWLLYASTRCKSSLQERRMGVTTG